MWKCVWLGWNTVASWDGKFPLKITTHSRFIESCSRLDRNSGSSMPGIEHSNPCDSKTDTCTGVVRYLPTSIPTRSDLISESANQNRISLEKARSTRSRYKVQSEHSIVSIAQNLFRFMVVNRLFSNDKIVTHTLSGGYGHTVQKTICYAFLDELYEARDGFQLQTINEKVPVKKQKGPLYRRSID